MFRVQSCIRASVVCVLLPIAATGCGETTARLLFALGSPEARPDGGTTVDGGDVPNTRDPISASGSVVGYAATTSDGLTTTTGGGTRVPQVAATCAELATLLQGDDPRVVLIESDVDCRKSQPETVRTCELRCDSSLGNQTIYRYLAADAADCSGVPNGSADSPIVAKPRDETTVYVGSNKTLLGITGAHIWGANLYLKDSSNVIIQNLYLGEINPALSEAGDAITIDGSHHVWVDHCQFWNVSDGFVDAINGAKAVTVSWNRFQGMNASACGGQHNFASTADGSQVTYHHNFFDRTLGCSPKIVRGSRAHLFNNTWSNVLYYSIQVASSAQALIEANEFDDSKKPFYASDSCFTDSTPCAIRAPSEFPNLFVGISQNESQDTGGTVDPLPYDRSTYQVEGAAAAKASVIASSGPR